MKLKINIPKKKIIVAKKNFFGLSGNTENIKQVKKNILVSIKLSLTAAFIWLLLLILAISFKINFYITITLWGYYIIKRLLGLALTACKARILNQVPKTTKNVSERLRRANRTCQKVP